MNVPGFDSQVTFLYTSDLEASTQFYEGLLGLHLVLDQRVCRIYQVSSGGYVGLCHGADVSENVGMSSRVIVTLVTRHVDEWYRHLLKSGVRVEKPPTRNPTYNIYHCFLRDPNGYLIEIQQFLDPSWPG